MKQCNGACIGAESPAIHNLRLKTALLKLKVASWPYKGAIAIHESDDLHLFDHWCYLGTAANESEVAELLSEKQPEFDLDIYKLMRKILQKSKDLGLRITPLPAAQDQFRALDWA